VIVDASALVEWLLGTARGGRVHARLREEHGRLHAPALLDIEVTSGLRRAELEGRVTPGRARLAVEMLLELDLTRHPIPPLVSRVWDLRHALSAYDATYVALAEALDMSVLTCDARMARSHGGSAEVHLV
jgi:predicted nucleic acid-binding protein